MARLRSPIIWLGGKGNMVAKILPILTAIPHTRYVEPFGGGASILMAKPSVDVETYNDLDSALYDFFTVLADPDLFSQFVRRVKLLPYSRQLYNHARAAWRDEPDKVKRAALWYVVARQSFGGKFEGSWGTAITHSDRKRAAIVSRWQTALTNLPQVHRRLQRVQIENADFMRVLERYDSSETLFYCDPPYVADTRKSGGYRHELTNEQHEILLDALLNIEGYVVISGYAHPIYEVLSDSGWHRVDWITASHLAGKTRNSNLQGNGAGLKNQKRIESLWISPNAVEFYMKERV